MAGRALVAVAAASVAVILVSVAVHLREPIQTWRHQARPPVPTRVLVVLDTVRSDHLSLCGYGRPTSPFLESLVARGASHTCGAYAPGSWTFPSHASYFTGATVTETGAHFVPTGTDIRQLRIRPLDPSWTTLAEEHAAEGFQTLGVSANPVLVPASGLDQGFADWTVAAGFGPLYGDGMVQAVRKALRAADPDRGLFVFLNIADAHDPWFSIPEDVGWVPARDDRVVYFETDPSTQEILPDGLWQTYVGGHLAPDAARAAVARVTDHYDHAVSQADDTFRRVWQELEAHGWTAAGVRLVVVSDHGEFLGEHQLLRHGRYLWEPNQRVPLLVLEEDADGTTRSPVLPALVSARSVHALVRTGALPPEPLPVEAVAFPDATWHALSGGAVGHETSAARWTGTDKLLWVDGLTQRTDLSTDPGEAAYAPVEGAPLQPLVDAVEESKARQLDTDPALLEALRAAGYLE